MSDEKKVVEQMQDAVATLRTTGEKMDAEVKKFGTATEETKAEIEKINADYDELKTRLDATELKIEKSALVKPGEAEDETKKAQKAAFMKWMRGGKQALEPAERKALVEDTTGLYLVPEEIEAEIIRAVPQLNVFRQLAPARTITRDKIRKRTLTEVSMGWGKLETGTEITESTLVPATDYIYAEDLYGLTKIGEDELMDTDANLQAIIADSFSIAKADEEEAAFVIGTGHTYSEPEGIAVDSTLRTDLGSGCGAAASGTYGISWATDDTAIPDDMLKAEYALPAKFLRGAAWLMHRKTELELRLVKASTAGTYLWQPSLTAGQPNNFDGFPIYNNGSMNYPDDTLAKTNVVFGNFRMGYRIVDRAGLAIQRLDELYAESGLVGFKAHFRVGGGIIRHDAFRIIVNDV